jgi:hypothetical protein
VEPELEEIPDDDHELVIDRVAAIDVAKAAGKVVGRQRRPIPVAGAHVTVASARRGRRRPRWWRARYSSWSAICRIVLRRI